MRILGFFLGAVLMQMFSMQVNAQYSFERHYNIPAYGGTCMVEVNDGFVVAGADDSSLNAQIILFKIDRKGSIIWSKKYWNDTSFNLSPVSLNLTDDSSYLISGAARELKSNGWCCHDHSFCMKTDKHGNLLWAKKLGVDSSDEFAGRSIITIDDGLIEVAIREDTTVYRYSSISKLDSNGNLEWCTNLNANETLYLNAPLAESNGNIICEGQYIDSDDYVATIVAKFDATGNMIWCRSYSFDVSFVAWNIVPTLCGYFVIGETDSTCCPQGNSLVMKIDGDGNFLWAKEYKANWFGQSLAAVETCNGGAAFTIWQQTGLSTSAGLIKIDSIGILEWIHLYGSNYYGSGINMINTADNGFMTSGEVNEPGVPLILFKTNEEGAIPCNDTSVIYPSYNKTCTVSNVGYTTSGIPIHNLDLTVSTFNLSDSLICLDSFAVTICHPVYCTATQVNAPAETSFNITPNPTSDYFTITYQTEKEITATVIDAFGREVKQFTLYPANSNQTVWVNDLPEGIYFVQLKTSLSILTKKIVVE